MRRRHDGKCRKSQTLLTYATGKSCCNVGIRDDATERDEEEANHGNLERRWIQILLWRLGYKKTQELLDDLALGEIPPSTEPGASLKELPTVEGSGRSREIDRPESTVEVKSKHASWAEEMEATVGVATLTTADLDPDLAKKGINTPINQPSEAPMSKPGRRLFEETEFLEMAWSLSIFPRVMKS